jgi:hypothetical protein
VAHGDRNTRSTDGSDAVAWGRPDIEGQIVTVEGTMMRRRKTLKLTGLTQQVTAAG